MKVISNSFIESTLFYSLYGMIDSLQHCSHHTKGTSESSVSLHFYRLRVRLVRFDRFDRLDCLDCLDLRPPNNRRLGSGKALVASG